MKKIILVFSFALSCMFLSQFAGANTPTATATATATFTNTQTATATNTQTATATQTATQTATPVAIEVVSNPVFGYVNVSNVGGTATVTIPGYAGRFFEVMATFSQSSPSTAVKVQPTYNYGTGAFTINVLDSSSVAVDCSTTNAYVVWTLYLHRK